MAASCSSSSRYPESPINCHETSRGHYTVDPEMTKDEVKSKTRKVLECLLDDIMSNNFSEWFREPVDGNTVKNYYDVIKNPMDLKQMREKLNKGLYESDPWAFIKDLQLIVSNATTFNRGTESNSIYVQALQLMDIFQPKIDTAMKKLGYCCGIIRKLEIRALACYAYPINECQIGREADYYILDDQYAICVDCQKEKEFIENNQWKIKIYTNQEDRTKDPGEIICLLNDFVKKRNDESEEEPLIRCEECHRRFHRICINFIGESNNFKCHNCCPIEDCPEGKPFFRKNEVTSKSLIQTPLSRYLEKQVKNLHEKHKKDFPVVPVIRIRVLSTEHKVFETKPQMKQLFCNFDEKYKQKNTELRDYEFPEEFPYTSRAIFVFQDQPQTKSEIMLFGLHVNEYSDLAKDPNDRRLYISYLDSVHYFEPKGLRTITYYEIILSYMDFMRRSGFKHASIWSCPPAKNDDYIFYVHPKEQKIPDSDNLLVWYEKLFSHGIRRRIISDFCDISRRAQRDEPLDLEGTSLKLLPYPYLDGDFWPKKIEEELLEVGERLMRNNNFSLRVLVQEVNTKIRECMEEEQNVKVFFSVELADCDAFEETALFDPIGILDIDLSCDIFAGREPFLTLCRQEFMQFGTERTATHSTQFIVKRVLNDQKQSSFRFFNEVLHALKCNTEECNLDSCRRYKRIMKIKNPTDIMISTMKDIFGTNYSRSKTIREAMLVLAKDALTHHVSLCQETHDKFCTSVKREYYMHRIK